MAPASLQVLGKGKKSTWKQKVYTRYLGMLVSTPTIQKDLVNMDEAAKANLGRK